METIQQILNQGTNEEKKALFIFSSKDSDEAVRVKFNLWARYNFAKYFTSPDAPFHKNIDLRMIESYRGKIKSFTNAGFRGCAKTSRTKLFIAFCILNDTERSKKYIKILAADTTNSKQIVTDVYNMLVKCESLYPDTFLKTNIKREETMGSFTTYTGVKVVADTVGTEARGALQEEARPDWILFEDFETRKTLRSPVITKMIWDNMEEARTSLAKDGASIYNCNYLSERGNVHKLILKKSELNIVIITPIITDEGIITWPARYTLAEIEQMKKDDDDFEGERLCKPSASKDILFDRDTLKKMVAKTEVKKSGELKIFYPFDPSHRFASGHDVAGGVGLDSSTSVFIDFDTVPNRVVATYKDNTIKPDIFGYEVNRQSDIYGGSLTAIEKNNHGLTTITICKQEDTNLYFTEDKDDKVETTKPKEYGWHTNAATKPKMIFALVKAVNDGLLELTDQDLINEAMSYSRDDLMDSVVDPRLTTRHFDLLIGACIAWQMRNFAEIEKKWEEPEEKLTHSDIGI